TLSAVVRDTTGATAPSAGVTVTVNNIVLDTIAPVISMTSPVGGAILSGNSTISANASDNVGVGRGQFKVDSTHCGGAHAGPGLPACSSNWTALISERK